MYIIDSGSREQLFYGEMAKQVNAADFKEKIFRNKKKVMSAQEETLGVEAG